jgi:hypothetical protein
MKQKAARIVLTILLVVVAVFGLTQVMLILTGVWDPPGSYRGTPFAGATVTMLLVTIIVGGSSLLAAATLFFRYAWGVYLAATVGLITIAWELIRIAVVGQFSSIFVYVGLAVIALAEYLWTSDVSGQQLPPAIHEVVRGMIVAIAAFIATSAIAGGSALLRGELDRFLSDAWLAGTPFGDYTIPALVLVIVVGGSALLAAATAFIHRRWAVLASVLAGVLMAGYLVVEAVILDSKVGDALPTVLALQLFYFALGLALFVLAGFLWMREYRGQRFRLRHVPRLKERGGNSQTPHRQGG